MKSLNISVLLAVIFFILPIALKMRRKQRVELTDLAKCTLAAMALPDLLICLFYLTTMPSKAIQMVQAPQYLTIAVLIIAYLSIQEIQQALHRKRDTS